MDKFDQFLPFLASVWQDMLSEKASAFMFPPPEGRTPVWSFLAFLMQTSCSGRNRVGGFLVHTGVCGSLRAVPREVLKLTPLIECVKRILNSKTPRQAAS